MRLALRLVLAWGRRRRADTARYNGFDWEVLPPISGGTPGGYASNELEGGYGITRVGTTLHIVGGFARPSYGYGRFVGNRMVPGDITIPNYGVATINSSPLGALAFGLWAGHPTEGSHPWVKPTDMNAYPPLITTVDCDEPSEWDLYVVGPTTLDSFSNFSTNAHVFFAPLVVQAGEYVRVSLRGNRIEARSSRGTLYTSNYLYYSDVPGRLALMPGDNHLQLAMHAYGAATQVSIGVRRKIRSFDYAE